MSISVDTPSGFSASEQRVAASTTVATVPGLGDANYILPGIGEVYVLKGDTQVEVLATGATDAQVEMLASQIINS